MTNAQEQAEPVRGDLLLSSETLPLPPTREGILRLVQRVLAKEFVQEIVVSVHRGVEVTWYRDVSDSLQVGAIEPDADYVLARIELEDFTGGGSGKEHFLSALLSMSLSGEVFPAYVLAGSLDFLKDWLGIPKVVPFPPSGLPGKVSICGLYGLETQALEEDVVVLLGGSTKDAPFAEMKRGLRIL